jgi:hypothetical protein
MWKKKMSTGITFIVDGKLCICIGKNELLCRIDPALHETFLKNRAAGK